MKWGWVGLTDDKIRIFELRYYFKSETALEYYLLLKLNTNKLKMFLYSRDTTIWLTRSTFLQSLALTLIKHTWAC